jgi:hypothetical protein
VPGQPIIWFDFEGSLEFLTRCDVTSQYVFKVSGGWVARGSSNFSSCGSPTYAFPKANTEFYSRCQIGALEGGYRFSDSSGGLGKRITVNPCGYRVTSNTGKISERSATTPPTVTITTGGCALSIAYTDNSSERIPLSECYEWALIVIDCPQWVCDTLDNLINLVGNF